MSYSVTKEHVWVAAIDDRAGAMAEKLQTLSDGGLNLEFIISRRDRQGGALLFISPLRTLDEIGVAEQAGFKRSAGLHSLRIAGPNRKGLGCRIACVIAAEGISVRGVSAAAIGDQQVTNIAFDTDEHASRARRALELALR